MRISQIQLVHGAGYGDVEKAAFFFEAVVIFAFFVFVDDATAREFALGEPDDEDDFPLESFRLVNGAETDALLIRFVLLRISGVLSGEEAELAQEFLQVIEADGVVFELLEVLTAVVEVSELAPHVVFINATHDGRHHRGGGLRLSFAVDEFVEGVAELLPGRFRFGGDFEVGHDLGEDNGLVTSGFSRSWGVAPRAPECVSGFVADAGKHFDNALEGDLIPTVVDHLHEGGDVLDMGLLEETKAARNFKRDIAIGQLELEFHRVKVGAVEDGDFVELDAFVAQFEDTLSNEGGLGIRILERSEGREVFGRGAPRGEVLRELFGIGSDRGIGQSQNLGNGSVVGLDDKLFRSFVSLRKVENVAEVSSAPGVDGLRIVANDHEVSLRRGKKINELGLDGVGVLILIDEDPLELLLVLLADAWLFVKELERFQQEIIEIHRVRLLLFLFVGFFDQLDGFEMMSKVGILGVKDVSDTLARIVGEAEDVTNDVGLGESGTFSYRYRILR